MAALAGSFVLVVGASVALAAQHFATHIVVEGRSTSSSPGSFDFAASGHLESAKRRCIRGRTVKLQFKSGDNTRVVDVDRSSLNGAWAVRAHSSSAPDHEFVAVASKRFGRPHHRKVCRPAREEILFFPGP